MVSIGLVAIAVRPLLPAGTLSAARGMPATVLLSLIVAGAFFGSEIYVPYLFIERYDFSPSVSLGLEALNLLDEKQRTYDGVDEALRTNLFFGRIYKASVSLKF